MINTSTDGVDANAVDNNQPQPAIVLAPTVKKIRIKKGPSPVFSVPCFQVDKTTICLRAEQLGISQKRFVAMCVEAYMLNNKP